MTKTKDEIIAEAARILKIRRGWNWRNNAALAQEIGVEPDKLQKVLTKHATSPNRKIRYHPLPSKHKMDILWGHVDLVGETDEEPSLIRTDKPDVEETIDLGRPTLFLSHNHHDAEKVLALAGQLKQRRVPYWLFETHIGFRDIIITRVHEALEKCAALLVFVSPFSLGSTWVQKEFGFVLGEMEKPTLAVFDSSHTDLANLYFRPNDQPFYQLAERYVEKEANRQGITDNNWKNKAAEFLHQLEEYLERGNPWSLYPNLATNYNTQRFSEGLVTDWLEWCSEIAGPDN